MLQIVLLRTNLILDDERVGASATRHRAGVHRSLHQTGDGSARLLRRVRSRREHPRRHELRSSDRRLRQPESGSRSAWARAHRSSLIDFSHKHTNIKGCFSLKGPTVPITALPSESIIVGDSGSSMIFKGGKISKRISFLHQCNKTKKVCFYYIEYFSVKEKKVCIYYTDFFLVIWCPFWWVIWLQKWKCPVRFKPRSFIKIYFNQWQNIIEISARRLSCDWAVKNLPTK